MGCTERLKVLAVDVAHEAHVQYVEAGRLVRVRVRARVRVRFKFRVRARARCGMSGRVASRAARSSAKESMMMPETMAVKTRRTTT
eukprot:scaffold27262_cov54-Phaeocystis_antarctica.AAC.1